MKKIIVLSLIGILFSCASQSPQIDYSDNKISKSQEDKNQEFIRKVSEDSKKNTDPLINHNNGYGDPNAKSPYYHR